LTNLHYYFEDFVIINGLYKRTYIDSHIISLGNMNPEVDTYTLEDLREAAKIGNLDLINLITKTHESIMAEDTNHGNIALLEAAGNNHLPCVELLITLGANKEAIDNDGNSILMIAAKNGSEAMITYLLDHGANREVINKVGQGLITVAKDEHIKQFIQISVDKLIEKEIIALKVLKAREAMEAAMKALDLDFDLEDLEEEEGDECGEEGNCEKNGVSNHIKDMKSKSQPNVFKKAIGNHELNPDVCLNNKKYIEFQKHAAVNDIMDYKKQEEFGPRKRIKP